MIKLLNRFRPIFYISIAAVLLSLAAWMLLTRQEANPPQANQGVTPNLSAVSVGEAGEPAPKRTPAAVDAASASVGDEPFRDRLANAFGLNPDRLMNVFEKGRNPELATAEDQFLAQQVGAVCEQQVTRQQRPDFSRLSPDAQQQAMAAQARMDQVCARFYSVKLDELRAANQALLARVEAKDSVFSRQFGALQEDQPNRGVETARQQLRHVFDVYGAQALLWTSGSLAEVMLARQTSERANEATGLPDTLTNMATVIAMCYGGVPCQADSLIYLSMCAQHGNCGGDVVTGLTRSLPDVDRQAVRQQARRIAEDIAKRNYSRLFGA